MCFCTKMIQLHRQKKPDDLEHQVFCVYRQDCEVDPKELGLRHNVVGCKLVLEMYF